LDRALSKQQLLGEISHRPRSRPRKRSTSLLKFSQPTPVPQDMTLSLIL
jgi:hypothetical protein